MTDSRPPETTEGWRLLKNRETGRVVAMRYVADACDGGAWFTRDGTAVHPDTVSIYWEELQDG